MTDIQIRGYQSADEPALLGLWSASLPFDPIDAATFRLKVLLDPNFHPDWLLVAERGGKLVGFCLCLIRRMPMDKGGLDPEYGWISALGVHPEQRRQGVGAALLDRAIELFRSEGRRQVFLASYTPNYFVPGVDVHHYAQGLAFLEKRGFETTSRPLSMDANIVLLDPRPYQERERALEAQGLQIRALEPFQVPDLMGFLQEHMPGDWVRHGRELLIDITRGRGSWAQFTLAWHQG
jgi:ribosomal protein S18 acetylase RimI-like enzyme